MNFSKKWLRNTVYEASDHVNQIQMTYEGLLALQLDPPRWRGDMGDGRCGGREGGWKRGKAEEVRQERKEEARQIGRRRKGRKEEARQGGGREGRPFEPGAALEFQPDFKRFENIEDIYMVTKCTNAHYVYDKIGTPVAHRLP